MRLRPAASAARHNRRAARPRAAPLRSARPFADSAHGCNSPGPPIVCAGARGRRRQGRPLWAARP